MAADTHNSDSSLLGYQRQGSGQPLVLVHGYFGGGAVWQHQIEALSKHFDVIAPEHAGYGDSADKPGCESINDFVANILTLLDSLGIEKFHLLGHSMGGMIVQQLTADHPERVRRLVCYGTGPRGVMPNRFETIEQSRQRLLEQGAAPTGRRIAATWFKRGSEHPAYAATCVVAEQMSLQSALAGLTAMEAWDGCVQLTHIKQPTLVLWGDSDQSYQWPQPETLWREIPNASLAVMPNCGHNAHMENPELFNHLVIDFLTTDI